MPPTVSVIVPNYNHAPYLDQRIGSILAQTWQDYEIILLDDCSTDDSRDVIERYRQHPKVSHVVYGDTNSGSTFKQWDKGIALASGEFIWIAESDDWCEPTLLENLVEGIRKDPDCVLSYCQAYFVGDDGRINWQSRHSRLSEMVDGREFIREYLPDVTIYNASMALWRKDRFARVPKDFTQYKFCGDWVFWIGLAQLGKVHICGKLLNYFRQHGNNVSTRVYKSGLSFVEELEIINTVYGRGLIGDREYKAFFKRKYREFWPVRKGLDETLRTKIETMFRNPLSPGTKFLPIHLSAVWRGMKGA